MMTGVGGMSRKGLGQQMNNRYLIAFSMVTEYGEFGHLCQCYYQKNLHQRGIRQFVLNLPSHL